MFTIGAMSQNKARATAKIVGAVAALPCCWATAMIVYSIMQGQPLTQGVAIIGGISTTMVVMAVAGLGFLQPARPRPLPQTVAAPPAAKQTAPHNKEQLT